MNMYSVTYIHMHRSAHTSIGSLLLKQKLHFLPVFPAWSPKVGKSGRPEAELPTEVDDGVLPGRGGRRTNGRDEEAGTDAEDGRGSPKGVAAGEEKLVSGSSTTFEA